MVNPTPLSFNQDLFTFKNTLSVKVPDSQLEALSNTTLENASAATAAEFESIGGQPFVFQEESQKKYIDPSEYVSIFDTDGLGLPGINMDEEGNLYINLIKLGLDEFIEVQALSGGKIIEIIHGLGEIE